MENLKCSNCASGCDEASQALNDAGKLAFKCKITGVWIYKKLPDGMRLATKDDFFFNDIIKENLNIPVLLHSFYSELYSSYTVTADTRMDDFMYFVEHKHCYLKGKTKEEIKAVL